MHIVAAIAIIFFLSILWYRRRLADKEIRALEMITIARGRTLREKYTDYETEKLTEEKLLDSKKFREVSEELFALVDQIPGCEGFRFYHWQKPWYKMCIRLLLAKEGKMIIFEADGMAYHPGGHVVSIPHNHSQESRKDRKMMKKMLLFMEEELQSHGVPIVMKYRVVDPPPPFGEERYVVAKEYDDPTDRGKEFDGLAPAVYFTYGH